MKRKFFSLTLFVLLTLFLATAASWPSSAPQLASYPYTVTDIGVFPGGSQSVALGLNDLGQVVGMAVNPDLFANQAFLWLPEPAYGLPTGLNNLGTLGGDGSGATEINNNGQVTGSADADPGGHAFLWQNGNMMSLGTLIGDNGDSVGLGINEAGQIAGETETDEWNRAFLWEDGTMAALDNQDRDSEATDINEAGHIVGWWESEIDADMAFFLADGVWTDLGLLGGDQRAAGAAGSQAFAINNADQIVGRSHNTDGSLSSAFIYLFEPAYNLPAGMNPIVGSGSIAYGINNLGQVVGEAFFVTSSAAFLWECGLTTNLNDQIDPASGWTLGTAYDINEEGQIAGQGFFNGQIRAFLLTPANDEDTGVGRAGECGVSFSHALYLPVVMR